MNHTPEQSAIISHVSSTEGLTMVSAVAGAGKTTLLVSLANAISHTNGLYMAYNKKIATEAKTRFPSTTHCCTTHSFAYGPTVVDHKLKLGLFTYRQVLEPIPYERKCELVDLINEFCLSEFTTFSDFLQDPQLTPLANKYLSLMQSGSIECTHAFYLKYFHILLASNHLSYEPFDFIMLDESGDLNPVTLAIFNLLPSPRKIMVGDACMPGDTRIKTTDGWRRLSSIVKSVNAGKPISVWSYNHTTSTFEFKPVTGAISTGIKQCYLLKTTRSSVECTANHKIATPDGYKRLDELAVGDLILKDGDSSLDNTKTTHTVDVVTSIAPTRLVETFDIEVQDNHNFIASKTAQKSTACGILVHNCQNIYGFNHTINCFDVMQHSGTTFPMSQSFRVSDVIASRIQTFCRRYLSPNMNFVGIPIESTTIHSRAYISRTNSQLVSKMMELNKLGTPYALTRPAKQIFRVPLLVCGLKPGGFIPDPEYKHLQVDVDTYAKSATLQRLYSSLFSYLKELHADDSALQTAMSTVIRYGAKAIIECFNEAKRHEHSRSNYTLTTAHACKGCEYDEVEIADDLNKSIKPLLDLTEFDSEQQAELNLYYVACSRARIHLINSLI